MTKKDYIEHWKTSTEMVTRSIDYEPIKRILTRFPRLELHTFPAGEDESSNPFIGEIKKHGLLLDLTPLHQAAAS